MVHHIQAVNKFRTKLAEFLHNEYIRIFNLDIPKDSILDKINELGSKVMQESIIKLKFFNKLENP